MIDSADLPRQIEQTAGSPDRDQQLTLPPNGRRSSQRVLRDMTNPKSRLL